VHILSPDIIEMVMAHSLGRPPRRALEKMIRELWAWRAFQIPHQGVCEPSRDSEDRLYTEPY
jgi:hypothetical protein